MSRKLKKQTLMWGGGVPMALGVALAAVQLTATEAKAIGYRRPVDLVICLDTSGSMTALIDSARAKIWDIVNELASASPAPQLRVGLLTYGTPGNSRGDSGWIVRHTDLTDDLDTVYAKMMAMRTAGGDEYVGWVLHDALHTMSWSRDKNALKIVFVAGNESADQARERYDFRHVGETARAWGVFVNAIYAGNRATGMSEAWHEVAAAGGGNYSAIDMSCGTIQIPTPQDDLLYRLNQELNQTYVPYGAHGQAGCANQVAQDANAAKMGVQSLSSRASAKGTALYANAFWDLVDALREGTVKLSDIKDADLPENMRSMNASEREAYIEGMRRARGAVQQQIQEASAERQKFLDAERRKQSGGASLDDAILQALRQQAEQKGFKFGVTVEATVESDGK